MHKIYTGCFSLADGGRGIAISSCDDCFCKLKNGGGNDTAVYRSLGRTHRSSHVVGDVCLSARSEKICDGVSDCVDGEDEAACAGGRNRRFVVKSTGPEIHNVLLLCLACVAFAVYFAVCLAVIGSKKEELEAEKGNDLARSDGVQEEDGGVNSNWSWNCASLKREIGHGFYGVVYLAEEVGGRLVAVKTVVDSSSSSREHKTDKVFANEIGVLRGLATNANVVRMVGFNAERELLVFEYCSGGSVKSFLQRNLSQFVEVASSMSSLIPVSGYVSSLQTKLDAPQKGQTRLIKWAAMIATGMEFLDSAGVVHGDLALRNVLLTGDDVAKISDFGLARKRSNNTELSANKKGLPMWRLPPECFGGGGFTAESDVWSFGVLLWELFSLARSEPYSDVAADSLASWLAAGNRLEMPSGSPGSVRALAASCWSSRTEDRPEFGAISEILADCFSDAAAATDVIYPDRSKSMSPASRASTGINSKRSCYWNGYKIMNSETESRRNSNSQREDHSA